MNLDTPFVQQFFFQNKAWIDFLAHVSRGLCVQLGIDYEATPPHLGPKSIALGTLGSWFVYCELCPIHSCLLFFLRLVRSAIANRCVERGRQLSGPHSQSE